MKRYLTRGVAFIVAASILAASMPMTAIAEESSALVAVYETSTGKLEAGKSYTVKAELRNANESGNKSMAGAVMLEDAEINVDAQGNAKLTLHFAETQIMNITCHATGLYLASKDGESLSGERNSETGEVTVNGNYVESDFVLNDDNSATATVTLPYIAEDGYYQCFINSSFMASSVALWLNFDSVSEVKEEKAFSGYVLMNVPYSEFYSAETASIGDVDAITSATNKVGNYGKAGGAYHNGTTAAQAEDGSWTAVGGENGAKLQGVTWAVKADSLDDVKALGGTEIKADSAVTTATAAHGAATSNDLKGYQTLTEAPAYSYYVLDEAPENYLVLENGKFKAGSVNAAASTINVTASYGTNWGDVQLNASEAADAADKIINAVVLTADDGTTKGLTQLGQVWSSKDIAWKVSVIDGLDGKTIKNIRYYCTVKDTDLTDSEVPAYVNYVYDYSVDLAIPQVYTGTVSAEFDNANSITLSGLPSDVQNLTAKVYYTTGGRNAQYTYLTPVVTDPSDDDNDPIFVNVENNKIAITSGSTTNKAGVTVNYGEPVDGTTYTVELSSSNYIINKITVDYKEPETLDDGKYTADIEFLKIDSDTASSAGRSFNLKSVPITAENGKLGVQLLATGNTASMITKIEQDVNGEYAELPFTEVEGGKYVTATLDSVDDIKNIRFTINTGSSYGVMVNEARVRIVADSVKEYFSGYVLMNVPYSDFYSAETASIGDVDAITSATNKVGNYGKAGGAYHSGTTAAQAEDGSWTAVGGENGAKLQGVTWAVKADSLDDVKALGGTEIKADSAVTTATAAHGAATSNDLKGYQTLTEAPAYSYYVLDEAPENYLVLENGKFKAGSVNAAASTINVTASYGTNWGDVQLNASEAADAADKIINAVVLTADDGTTKGLTQLGQVWSSKDIAWKVSVIDGLDGKTIKNIRYYCTVKDTDLTDSEVPAYVNYVYDYSVDLAIPQVYTGTVSAEFDNANSITLSGLPSDVQNLTAKVYYTTGGRNAQYTYLTPVVTDPSDDDNDPIFVNVENNKIAITSGSTTNKAGVTVNYGEPVDGTTYTIELSSGNYIINKITTVYTEKQQPAPQPISTQAAAKAEKAADNTIRFVAGIDSLNYKEVGFIFEVDGKEVRRSTNTVYSSIAESKFNTADFENAKYLYSFEISDIADLGKEIKVTPYSVDLKGNEVKSESSVYSLNALAGEVNVQSFAEDAVESGSAVEVYAEETSEKEDVNTYETDVDKKEAILSDTELAVVEEVLD